MSQQTAASAFRADPSEWPGISQIRNRNSSQSLAAWVLAETELWALREAKFQLEKLLMEDPGSPINQSTKQPCLCGCVKREEAIPIWKPFSNINSRQGRVGAGQQQ